MAAFLQSVSAADAMDDVQQQPAQQPMLSLPPPVNGSSADAASSSADAAVQNVDDVPNSWEDDEDEEAVQAFLAAQRAMREGQPPPG